MINDSSRRIKQQKKPLGRKVGQENLNSSSNKALQAPSQQNLKDESFDGISNLEKGQKDYFGVNQILVHQMKGKEPNYYIPAYLVLKINKINQINYIQSKATISCQIRIWLMIKQFPKAVQQEIVSQAKFYINGEKQIKFQQIQQPPKLDSSLMKNKSSLSVGFLYNDQLQLDISSDPFWSPFELIRMIANVEIRKIKFGDDNPEFQKSLSASQKSAYVGATAEFNFLDAHPFLQFSFKDIRNLGSFDIAEKYVDMKFSNQFIKDEDEAPTYIEEDQELIMNPIQQILGLKEKVKFQKLQSGQILPDAFENGQIVIPVYKYPTTTIVSIFLPLYIVGIINLGVFFQDKTMGDRIANLAAFLLAYVAFLPTIRQNLPETPKMVFTQILVYAQISCTLVCFFDSIYIDQTQQDGYKIVWNQQPAFLICVALTGLNILIVVGLMLIHKLVWERDYNTLPKNSKKYIGCKHLNTDDNEEWFNDQCEEEFQIAYKAGVIKPFNVTKRKDRKKKNSSAELVQNWIAPQGQKNQDKKRKTQTIKVFDT